MRSAPMHELDQKPEFEEKLAVMTDDELFAECDRYIWLSAYAANNARSAYHWRCDATYAEATRRGNPDIYDRAYKRNLRAAQGR